MVGIHFNRKANSQILKLRISALVYAYAANSRGLKLFPNTPPPLLNLTRKHRLLF